jgi:hypothetical protein
VGLPLSPEERLEKQKIRAAGRRGKADADVKFRQAGSNRLSDLGYQTWRKSGDRPVRLIHHVAGEDGHTSDREAVVEGMRILAKMRQEYPSLVTGAALIADIPPPFGGSARIGLLCTWMIPQDQRDFAKGGLGPVVGGPSQSSLAPRAYRQG